MNEWIKGYIVGWTSGAVGFIIVLIMKGFGLWVKQSVVSVKLSITLIWLTMVSVCFVLSLKHKLSMFNESEYWA